MEQPRDENLDSTEITEKNGDTTLDKMCSKFDVNWCMKNPAKQTNETEIVVNDINTDVEAQDKTDDTLEKMYSTFDVNCCVKNPAEQTIESEQTIETEKIVGDINPDIAAQVQTKDPSMVAAIQEARLKDIDLESGGETEEDEDNFHSGATKSITPWYREPFYATLISLCIIFSIAIIVMASLLLKK